LSAELILGIVGTAAGSVGASYAIYQMIYNKPRFKISNTRCKHWTWSQIDKTFTAFRVKCLVNNRGHIGTRLTKAVLEFDTDKHYVFAPEYVDQQRIEPTDSTSIDITFSEAGISIRDSPINCKVLLYHTYGVTPLFLASEFTTEPERFGV
jgi:hypothetical protein